MSVVGGNGLGPNDDLAQPCGNATQRWNQGFFDHLVSGSTSAPTGVVGAAAGTGGSLGVSVTGNDLAFSVAVTAGASGTTSGTYVTITPHTAYGATPRCVFVGGSQQEQFDFGWSLIYDKAASSSSSLVFKLGQPPTANSTFDFHVLCVE